VTPWLKPIAEGGVELSIHIQPGAAKSEISGLHGDALKIRIQARPVEGAANAALTDFLAACLQIPRKSVRIIRGEKSRHKTIWLAASADKVEEIVRQLMQ
jgi:uncharacterized protein (TIGR00251 family)